MDKYLLLIVLLSCQIAGAAPAPLTVAWRNKPPLQYLENGEEKGLLLERARRVFAEANVPVRFVEEPAKRIWANFSGGTANYCSIGWYHLAEREKIAQYSAVFHTDPPHTVLLNIAAQARIAQHKSLLSLLADPSLTLGLVDNVSYGPELDALIGQARNHIERDAVAPMVMARMVQARRADYMFIDTDDWTYLHGKNGNMREIVELRLSDMPKGLNRYIVCSKDVAPATMRSINAALARILAAAKQP
ncbi:MAG: transporter substrate-binding domain-containing protein [Burkholderiales bacterium]|nr:transporter substrate-binding domain-containing protein [Burkholderiales bacterium]